MTGGQGSMSKLKGGDVAMWATRTCMDLVGPYAQTRECPLEKWFRDAKIYQLFEGTAEIQRLVDLAHAGRRVPGAARGRREGRGGRDGRSRRPANGSGPNGEQPRWPPSRRTAPAARRSRRASPA